MKFVKILFTVFVLTVCTIQISMFAFAEDLYPENTTPAEDNPYYQTVPATQPATEFIQDDFSPATQPATEFIQDDYRSDPVIVEAVSPITPSNTNGFQSVILGLLGNYSPVVVEYAYTSSQGYVSYLREIQPDYSWLAGAVIFLVVIYCLFRLIGALIKK